MASSGAREDGAVARARVVLVTHPRDGAEAFARALVDARVAACVNLLDVTSVYRWQGAVETDAERLLVVKTSRERLADLERFLGDRHPYDVPELVALEPEHVAASYLRWLLDEVAPTA